ncbi:MAG: CNNM domain-containing protein, partial [Pseudomonadota bacterium]
MDQVPLSFWFGTLAVLLLLSAFFSGSETALMSVNRYRLRHAAKLGSKSAQLTEQLLRKPERIIGLILIGNNVVNIGATLLTAWLSAKLGGIYFAIGPTLLIIVVLLFCEVGPKTL